jgi:hypothetical protein
MKNCPRCKGFLLTQFKETFCIPCGWRPNDPIPEVLEQEMRLRRHGEHLREQVKQKPSHECRIAYCAGRKVPGHTLCDKHREAQKKHNAMRRVNDYKSKKTVAEGWESHA